MRPFFFLSSGLALAFSAAYAQEAPFTPPNIPSAAPAVAPIASDEPEITLQELLRRAIENNPRLRIAQENVTSANERAKAVRSLPNPTLQLVPGFTGSSTARDEEVIVAQPLDLFGLRRARGQVLSADARRAQTQQSLARRALEVEVRNAASLLFAAQEAEKLEQAQVEIAGLFRDAAARRSQLGDVPTVQAQRAQLEFLRAQNLLTTARTTRLSRRAAVNLLIGDEPSTPLRVVAPLEVNATGLLSLPATTIAASPTIGLPPATSTEQMPTTSATVGGILVAPDAGAGNSSVATRPDVLGAQASLEARRAQVKAIGRELLPSVELQARRSSFFGRDGSYSLRAVVTLPLFDFGSIKGQRRAAEADVRAQEASLKLLQQQAAAQVEIARVQLDNRRQLVARYQQELLPLALDLLRKTQIGYAQGVSNYLEVLEAQRSLRQLQTEYLQALVGVQTDESSLDAALNGGVQQLDSVQLLITGSDGR